MVSLLSENVSHAYGFFHALKGVSLEINPGDCFALFGPNGAGKTTLMKIFATLLSPTQGQLSILGKDAVRDRDTVRASIFFVGHGSFLYDDLTAIENIEFAIGIRGRLPPLNEIKTVLDRVGIGAYASQKTRTLSAGMQKRLSLAKTILAQPELILFDEPYTALDENGVEMMHQVIRDFLARGAAVILSSHDRAKTAQIANRAGLLHHKTLKEIPLTDLQNALF
ncbi:MAG: heme ABC exporter ATP-binding protein CcmA [Nitrospirota bacterium]